MLAFVYSWHRRLSLLAGGLTLLWALSGLLHPFMSYFGPRPAAFMPPQKTMTQNPPEAGFAKMMTALEGKEITQLRLLKIERDWAWQVSTGSGFDYYDPDFGRSYPDFGSVYAEKLAKYYSGSSDKIRAISLQKNFDLDYPEISRLLPVYKVEFENDKNLRVFVDPSSDRLGGMTDNIKLGAMRLFQWVHTLSWLEPIEAVRVLIVFFSVFSILAISGLGIALRLARKPRLYGQKSRVFHGLLAYLVWLPVLMMTLSGLYHLVMHSTMLVTPSALPQQGAMTVSAKIKLPKISGDYTDLRLLSHEGKPIWRVSSKNSVSYIDAMTGHDLDISEEDWASGFVDAAVSPGTKVSMYTDEYGFAFKRLPVWRYETAKDIVFVDASEGLIAGATTKSEALENWSFTVFHKWQFLDPYTGRFWRDMVVVLVGTMITLMAGTGLFLRLRRRV